MGFFEALSRGLERSREALNEVFYFGGEVDEDFWENLEDTLVMGDMGAEISMQVTETCATRPRDAISRPLVSCAARWRTVCPRCSCSPMATSSAIPPAACCL